MRERKRAVRYAHRLIGLSQTYKNTVCCDMNPLTSSCAYWELEWSLILATSGEKMKRER